MRIARRSDLPYRAAPENSDAWRGLGPSWESSAPVSKPLRQRGDVAALSDCWETNKGGRGAGARYSAPGAP